ncbi:MAG: phosphatidylinositol mannoside acyltransferase [Actinomycetota bacterium]|nr:phosphatidylinositol mannoside acyltransferase [Actinomycetota bacterium]
MSDPTDALRPAARTTETGSSREPGTRAETITFHAYRLAAWAGAEIPEHTGRLLFRWLGLGAYTFAAGARTTVAANQAQVLGRPVDDPFVRTSTRDAFLSYARYWYDAFHATRLTAEEIALRFHVEGREHFDRAFDRGKGLIAALPHAGNWDVAGRWLQVEGIPMTTVAEQLKPERLFRLFCDHRESLGMDIVGLDSEGRVGHRLARALAANRLVALVADRDLTGRGVEVEMFGRPRKLPAGPALLALSSGAPVVVCALYDEGNDWRLIIGPTLEARGTGNRKADVMTLTRQIAEEFERAISAAPSQWHLFQQGWEP